MNFGHEKFFPWDFLEIVGNSIGKPGNKFFENSGHLKFGHKENSWENAGSILPK